jgi:hypothetical protein
MGRVYSGKRQDRRPLPENHVSETFDVQRENSKEVRLASLRGDLTWEFNKEEKR